MRLLLLATLIIMAGCTPIPVKRNFPPAPDILFEKCPDLQKLNDEPKLSELTKTIIINYNTYYECAVKHEAWTEWYRVQKELFDSVK